MTITITYDLVFEEGRNEHFSLAFEDEAMCLCEVDKSSAPDWTNLEFRKCPNCPLHVQDSPYCPAALHLSALVHRLGDIKSYEKVSARVITREREIVLETTMQRVFSSPMGLVIASSGCPPAAYYRPMARFHLPFASYEETIFRTTSTYLMAQYFRHHRGQKIDLNLEGLVDISKNIQTVNAFLAQRLRDSCEIAQTNAIAHLDLFAQALPVAEDESLEEFSQLFQAYL